MSPLADSHNSSNNNTYESNNNCLGRTLGAFAAEIASSAPDLAGLLRAWPTLSDEVHRLIVKLADAAQDGAKEGQ